jgi:DNA polymerase I-like protein with 3'-5' exonuclease and polymerase domains
MTGRLTTSLEQFNKFVSSIASDSVVAADVETYKTRPTHPNSHLLGLALSGFSTAGEVVSTYIPFMHYNKLEQRFVAIYTQLDSVASFIKQRQIVGWNVPFDKAWIDHYFNINTNWLADGRILWHLQNNDYTIRGYGLKLAQKKLLGWEDTNEKALEENVKMAGGRLKDGDHYLADLDVLSHYAALDTYSTLKAYLQLKPFMDKHDYWWFAKEILDYSIMLSQASEEGLLVDVPELMRAAALYKHKRESAEQLINRVCSEEIGAMQEAWKTAKLAKYKTVRGRVNFLEKQRLQKKFNPASGHQRALLLHDVLALPVGERTPTGLPKTDRANLSTLKHDVAGSMVQFSEYKKIYEATQTYLQHVEDDGRIHTNYDVCGTVSGRLSGFKPSVLNMPFSEPEVMRAFIPNEGYIGIHADLAAIEPCVLAHYSEDPTLLKVYKYGQGDIYLDLALDIFPENQGLRQEYNPNEKVTSQIKEKYKDLRALCKIVHLAVSYTGTHVTVAKNLSKAGFPTDKGKAMQLVGRYWKKFSQVKAFNHRIQEVYRHRGFIRNLVGRVIQVPDIFEKDLMNRLVQSSAHDILRLWVREIVSEFKTKGVDWHHWLPDLHDSTTFMVKESQKDLAAEVYTTTLNRVKDMINLSVPLNMEMKFMKTLAGVKVNE